MQESYKSQFRKGMLVRAILTALNGSELYASGLLDALRSSEFATQEGTVYPILARLRREGLLAYRWEESEMGPPRKYYSLTENGKKLLAELDEYQAKLEADLLKIGARK